MTKFKDMKYERLDVAKIKEDLSALTKELKELSDYEAAREVFIKEEMAQKHLSTMMTLASIRHSIDTRDKFYDDENNFWDNAGPEIEEYQQAFLEAMLSHPNRPEFEKEFGDLYFRNAEISQKAFDPAIIPEMQKEAELTTDYMRLIASAQIPFNGGTYTLSQLTPFKNDADDAVRLAAWKAEGTWYKENQEQLDRIYDELTHLRDEMGKKLGYKGYTELGYYRMRRNCYTQEDIEKFREAVRTYIVPIADGIYREQAERVGKEYPLDYSDAQLEFRSGNPKPCGTADDILKAGKKFYEELSPETGVFFNRMLDEELMDVLSTEGKASGGYCTGLADYSMPFIFANFNGTQGDVEVVTHEAGHAFADYLNADRIPIDYCWPSMEACEVHSMSMEFFAWPWAEDFFGDDAEKFRYSHLVSALKFIPYGTLVDHFQHEVYANPDMTPAERHATWKKLQETYMPWLRLDGEIPFYGEGEAWQRQNHIYNTPFYYIDYCLAQSVSLYFWAQIQQDPKKAWEQYMAYARQGGTATFRDLLKNAALPDPFEGDMLREVSEAARQWLDAFDETKLK